MANMQQFMKAISILAAGSHSTTEYAILSLFMNMVSGHFSYVFYPKQLILSLSEHFINNKFLPFKRIS